MKKIISLMLILTFAACVLCSCSPKDIFSKKSSVQIFINATGVELSEGEVFDFDSITVRGVENLRKEDIKFVSSDENVAVAEPTYVENKETVHFAVTAKKTGECKIHAELVGSDVKSDEITVAVTGETFVPVIPSSAAPSVKESENGTGKKEKN